MLNFDLYIYSHTLRIHIQKRYILYLEDNTAKNSFISRNVKLWDRFEQLSLTMQREAKSTWSKWKGRTQSLLSWSHKKKHAPQIGSQWKHWDLTLEMRSDITLPPLLSPTTTQFQLIMEGNKGPSSWRSSQQMGQWFQKGLTKYCYYEDALW